MIRNWSMWITTLLLAATAASVVLLVVYCCVSIPINYGTLAEYLLVIVLGLEGLLAAAELRSQRSSNFVAAWQTLIADLQKDNLEAGRSFLRQLRLKNISPDDPRKWQAPPDWDKTENHVKCAKEAYDGFDVAGIMVLHSKIPDLVDVLVAEYADSIIACWEQGECFFNGRVLELQPPGQNPSREYVRDELYQCFSVLYVMAKHRREVRPQTYPFYSLRELNALKKASSHWERKARDERDRLIRKALRQHSPIN